MSLVVDTDVLSFIFKKDTRAALYAPHIDGHILIASFQTVAELEQWTLASNWGARRTQDLHNFLKRHFIQHSSPALCRRWAEVMDSGRRKGKPIAAADAWNAATALLLGLPFVTHNHGDFAGVDGLTVISER